MPWREASVMDERERMLRKWEFGLYTVAELADEFGISRPTVYKWVERYLESRGGELHDRPPIPKTCPHRTGSSIAARILDAKDKYPLWGPAKLIDFLTLEDPEVEWPAPSTAGRILDQHGLVIKKRRRRNGIARDHVSKIEATESGAMMTTDHKGQIRLQNGQWCHPVTICDPVSKFIYAIDGKRSTSSEEAKSSFEQVFQAYGVPDYMLSDNGNPFCCSRSLGALSKLAVWWVKLGIIPLTIHKGCPWENGSHERMHKDLKAATTRPPGWTMREQQKKFDPFRSEYNNERPHETLNGKRPVDLLKPCKRPFSRKLLPIEYPGHYETRSVLAKGFIKWRGNVVFVGQALVRERVGLVETDDGIWTLFFSKIQLGRYDERTNRII